MHFANNKKIVRVEHLSVEVNQKSILWGLIKWEEVVKTTSIKNNLHIYLSKEANIKYVILEREGYKKTEIELLEYGNKLTP